MTSALQLRHASDNYFGALRNAIELWAESSTDKSAYHRHNLIHDKKQAVADFFGHAQKHPGEISTPDVVEWRATMEKKKLKPNTVYTRISRLAAFYDWLMSEPAFSDYIRHNPARLALPKRPKSYQNEKAKSYTDEEMQSLLAIVKSDADAGSIKAKRDYALLLIYFLSGIRRNEAISLRGTDIEIKKDVMILKYVRKGGRYTGKEVQEESARAAVDEYLRASTRRDVLGTPAPLWTRHDRAGRAGAQLSSHSFAKNLKEYGERAGIKDARIHRTRHTFARIVHENTGSFIETQDALDHSNIATTRIYVETISVKKDKHSRRIAERFNKAAAKT